ncbi:MAG TPA: phosphopantetheine-binding protein, partial [Herpetosiphonaceae bacterium]
GRADQQVKIRGFRIELGEIEAVLGQHASVREAVVIAREDTPGNKRLVAYIVGAPGARRDEAGADSGAVSGSELRRFLQGKLPSYMVPSAFVVLEALPLTPNGKVDRRALPTPDEALCDPAGTFVASRTPEEALIAEIWAELLQLTAVGIHDNFFNLGGHSLLATRLIARLRAIFAVDLPLSIIFEAPTIAGISDAIEELLIAKVEALPEDEIQRLTANMFFES